MATRDLLDPCTLLLVALGCSGCELGDDDYHIPQVEPRSCEVEFLSESSPHSAVPSRMVTADLRIACGNYPSPLLTNVGIGADGVYVMAREGSEYTDQLYRLDHLDNREHASVTELSWPGGYHGWLDVEVDDGGLVSMFGQSVAGELWRATPSNEDWLTEELGLEADWITRVEIAGSQPHLWLLRIGDDAEPNEEVHATISTDGTWFEQPSLSVEGMMTMAIGLDGSGNQLAYGLDEAWELWTFDGASTQHAGPSPTSEIIPVPTAHPTHPSHEHAAVLVGLSDVDFVWATRGEGPMVIPPSPTYANDPDAPCLLPSNVVTARTADGRVWLAWIVNAHPKNCEVSALSEAGTLRLVEVDPAHAEPREVRRVELDTDNLPTVRSGYLFEVFDMYDGALSLAAFDQQLVLVVADGPEEARLRVLSVDTSR